MSTLLSKIQTRGRWTVDIRPITFTEKRIGNISRLYPLLQETQVMLRGWDFPHLDRHTQANIDIDYLWQESEWNNYLEAWRFYQSGQFGVVRAMAEDWLDQSTLDSAPGGWQPGNRIGVLSVIFQFTEVFQFAANLAHSEAGDEHMHIGVTVSGLQGRALRFDSSGRWGFAQEMKASLQELPYEIILPRDELLGQPREFALQPARELFRRFGWDPDPELLRDMQSTLWR